MLQGAVIFSYLNAGLAVLALVFGGAGLPMIMLLGGVGAYGIANERRWGYHLCVVVAIVYLVLQVFYLYWWPFQLGLMLNLLFAGFLVMLLLHPISRSYQRIYFH
jgi:uncharacterized membrane protein (DUF2068 family)